MGFTCYHATRAAAIHVELYGVPVGGAPFPLQVLPSATFAAKSVVTGLARVIRAGGALRFGLQARDRYGNDRWDGGDAVRVLLSACTRPEDGARAEARPTSRSQRRTSAGVASCAQALDGGDVDARGGGAAGGSDDDGGRGRGGDRRGRGGGRARGGVARAALGGAVAGQSRCDEGSGVAGSRRASGEGCSRQRTASAR